jgi:NAD(P)-dependent dehydrogenase (short-subunit alcohol dehydrogenase family)
MTPFKPDLFAGRVYLVTGAAGGVGGSVAEKLLSLGRRLS